MKESLLFLACIEIRELTNRFIFSAWWNNYFPSTRSATYPPHCFVAISTAGQTVEESRNHAWLRRCCSRWDCPTGVRPGLWREATQASNTAAATKFSGKSIAWRCVRWGWPGHYRLSSRWISVYAVKAIGGVFGGAFDRVNTEQATPCRLRCQVARWGLHTPESIYEASPQWLVSHWSLLW